MGDLVLGRHGSGPQPIPLCPDHGGQGFGPQCSHPSCPKVMFSLNRRLSSRSSWVMWHHFSLQAQEVTGEGAQSPLRPSRSPPALPYRCQRHPGVALLTQEPLALRFHRARPSPSTLPERPHTLFYHPS